MQKLFSRALAVAGVLVTAVAAAIALFVAMQAASHKNKPAMEDTPGYIFDKNYVVSLEELSGAKKLAEKLRSKEGDREKQGDVNPADYMTKDFGAGVATLSYFRYLDAMFADSPDLPSHLEGVKKLVFEKLPVDKASRLYSLYEKYLTCELELANMLSSKKDPKTPADMIRLLSDAQNFRREYLGRELADALFGADIKALEYAIRRSAIVSEKTLHGREKEILVKQLTEDMWGDQAGAVESYSLPFNRYLEKLRMYALDMAELKTEKEKAAMLKDIRSSCFPPEVVSQLEKIDAEQAKTVRDADKNPEKGVREPQPPKPGDLKGTN